MKNKFVKILVLIVMMLGMIFALSGCSENNESYQNYINEQKEVDERQAMCEHDWVITSKYDVWYGSYKTISKCSKCGKEIE